MLFSIILAANVISSILASSGILKSDETCSLVLKRTFGVESIEEAHARPELHYLFPQLSVGDKYPPILLAHGTKDTAVPHFQSAYFSKFLTSKGLENELYLLEDRDHFWDDGYENNVIEVKGKIWAFLDRLAEMEWTMAG